jgi:hypothetical protein
VDNHQTDKENSPVKEIIKNAEGRNKMIVAAVLFTLALAAAVLFALNWSNIQDRQQILLDGELHLTHVSAGFMHVITVADIEALDPQLLTATLRGGGQPGVEVEFRAVPFRDLLAAYVPVQDDVVYSVVFTAADGFATVIAQDEAMQAAYIALCEDRGPFRLILPYDHFAQRWVHWLTGIELRYA